MLGQLDSTCSYICVPQLLYTIYGLTKRQYTQGLQLKDWQIELDEYNVIIIVAILNPHRFLSHNEAAEGD